jgi:hypothetical protein
MLSEKFFLVLESLIRSDSPHVPVKLPSQK